ncbi:MAG: ring-hydroxylating oxygenase subunit alpha [Acidiferrobacteraceae bacterium]|nr:ring-hydroxylating oxygenase subunit alpha [Acidiferrobacteraceae bacterium]|tara:strand:+ start:744 stop:1922 length:1179 start_codon:yes stop_codon:yes gene_type:complete
MIEANLTDNRLLASWTYQSSELLKIEHESLFHRHWLLVGHISQFRNPGDYQTMDVGGERSIVIRGQSGELRAFHNVCIHRGSRIVESSSGNCSGAIVCPFHGWTYHLDGRLKSVPRKAEFANLDIDTESLSSIECEIWCGFVFIRFKSVGHSLAEELAPVYDLVQPYKLTEVQPLGPASRSIIEANWKTFHDVDNEGYHVPAAHPSLQELYGRDYCDDFIGDIPLSTGTVDDYTARQWSVYHYKKILPEYSYLPHENRRLWMYISLFPNLVMFFYPEKVGFYASLPLAVDRTLIIEQEYGLLDTSRATQAVRYLSRRIDTLTGEEDKKLVDWMREAVLTSVYPRSSYGRLESGVIQFHNRLRAAIPLMRAETNPPNYMFREAEQSLNSGPPK